MFIIQMFWSKTKIIFSLNCKWTYGLLNSWRITTFWHSLDNTDNFFKVWERHGLELGMNFLVFHQNFKGLFATNLAFDLHTRNYSLYEPTKMNLMCKTWIGNWKAKSYLDHGGQFLVMQVISSSWTIFNENFSLWHCYFQTRQFTPTPDLRVMSSMKTNRYIANLNLSTSQFL